MLDITPEWECVTDTVMGGVSTASLRRETYAGRAAWVLRGDVSLANNGGFVQMAGDLAPSGQVCDARTWDGVAIDICGNDAAYDLRLRTDQLRRPWESFRAELIADRAWSQVRVPFAAFQAHKHNIVFDAGHLTRIGVLGIGRVFTAEIAVARVQLYRGAGPDA